MSGIHQQDTAVAARLRDNNFDLLRLVFALMVVLFHVGILSLSPSLRWLRDYVSATFAVQAFFFVSGFLVTMSYERSRGLRDYAAKRFWRIEPAYVLVVLGAAVLLASTSTLSLSAYFSSKGWRDYVLFNLALSNFSAPSLPGVFQSNSVTAVNGSLWTIKLEVAFYCFVPIIVWMVRRWGYRATLCAVCALSIAWKCGFTLAADHYHNELLLKLAKQIPGQLAFFAGGALGYYRTRDGLRPPPFWMVLVSVAAYALTDGVLFEAIAPIAVTLIVYWMAIALRRFPSPGKYGDFSYGLYLYHFPVVQVMVAAGWFTARPYLTTLELLACASFMAVASWFVVERRFLNRRASA